MSNTNSASGSIRVEVNSKDLMANRVKNDRAFYVRQDLSTQQLRDLVHDATEKSNLISTANEAVSRIADKELELVDKDGKPCTLAQKKAEINKRRDFPYNIPIIGWLIKKIEIATLESEHAEKRAEIKGSDPWNTIFTSQDVEEEKKMAEAKKKEAEKVVNLIGGAYKFIKDHKTLDEDVIKELEKFCQEHDIQGNDSVGKETLEKIAEAEKRDLQQNQAQTVAPAQQTQTQQVQTVKPPLDPNFKMPDGLKITNTNTVQAGAAITSGATGVGIRQSQVKGNAIGG